jgi:D-alanyl-lipoteichoic acid acyltransferase DltB (MBOAT superfamily)
LTSWLVDYIYWPIVRIGRNVAYFRFRPVLLSNLGMVITFIVCGAWHGETPNFIIWGAYHGLGISAMTIYQREKRKVRNGLAQRYFRSKLSQLIGVFFTFNYFVVGLVFFLYDFDKLKLLISKLF